MNRLTLLLSAAIFTLCNFNIGYTDDTVANEISHTSISKYDIDAHLDRDSWQQNPTPARLLKEISPNNHNEISLKHAACENWSDGYAFFELLMRYDLGKESSRGKDSISCTLAKNSFLITHHGKRRIPGVYFADLYILALNRHKINSVCEGGDTAFVTIAKRIADTDAKSLFISYNMAMQAFNYLDCSSEGDSISESDLISIRKYYPRLELDESFGQIADQHDRNTISPLNANAFSTKQLSYTNHWRYRLNWQDQRLKWLYGIVVNPDEIQSIVEFEEAYKSFDITPDLDILSEEGVSLAFQAYALRKVAILEFILEHGASAEAVLRTDGYDLVDELEKVVSGASFCPVKGDTLLLAAALDPFRRIDALPIILKYAKDVNVRDPIDRNALHRLLYHRVPDEHLHITKMLIDAGVDVNAKTKAGNTPSHVAVNRNARILRELIMAGADIHQKNDAGESPLELLKRSIQERWHFHAENKVVLDMLEKEGLLSKVK